MGDGRYLGFAAAQPGTAEEERPEVPSRAAERRIQACGRDITRQHPAFVESLLLQPETTGQEATAAEKHRPVTHALGFCASAAGAADSPVPETPAPDAEAASTGASLLPSSE